jgi:Ca2+-binding RTX toxin-like protein
MRKTFLVVASVALAMVVLGGVAWAANIKCPNAGIDRVWLLCDGTEKADTMQGTKSPDIMKAKSGADTMYGWGNGSVDVLYGGPGPDKMYGGQGGDYLLAGAGVDRVYGQGDHDRFLSGNTTLDGRQIDHTDDYYYGGAERDEFLVGGTNGVDRVFGGTGDDEIWVAGNAASGAKEIVDCGLGTEDFVSFDEGVDVVTNCELGNDL